jgi:hypothetical protein
MFIEHYSVIEMYIPSHYYTHVTPKPDRAVHCSSTYVTEGGSACSLKNIDFRHSKGAYRLSSSVPIIATDDDGPVLEYSSTGQGSQEAATEGARPLAPLRSTVGRQQAPGRAGWVGSCGGSHERGHGWRGGQWRRQRAGGWAGWTGRGWPRAVRWLGGGGGSCRGRCQHSGGAYFCRCFWRADTARARPPGSTGTSSPPSRGI